MAAKQTHGDVTKITSREYIENKVAKTSFKDTHREKAPLNKTPTSSKNMNIHIWVVGTSNQLFIPGS